MLDMNRERLQHLMANAILELWKKETGSLSSVIIEGTICVTSCGRTIVIQVADKFNCQIPEFEIRHGHKTLNHKGCYDGALQYAPSVDTHPTSTSAVTAYLDELSPASLVSPPVDGPSGAMNRESRPSSSGSNQQNNNNSSTNEDSRYETKGRHDSGIDVTTVCNESCLSSPMTNKIPSVPRFPTSRPKSDFSGCKTEDCVSSDEDDMRDLHEQSHNATDSSVPGGTGFYTRDITASSISSHETHQDKHLREEDIKDEQSSSVMDTTEEFATNENERFIGPFMSTPKSEYFRFDRSAHPKSSALDLSRRDPDDLALSPPQNYTAQVRDVIRQRLLAQKFSTNQLIIEKEIVDDSLQQASSSESRLPREDHSSGNDSRTIEERDSQKPDSLPPTPVNHFPPVSPLLSPDQATRLMFPFSPFAQHRNLLYAEHIQNLMKRSISGLVPQSPQPLERPPSEPVNMTSPVTPDKLSLSFDGRQTPQSSNGEQKVYSCDFCHKTFLFKSKYQEHLPVHTNARPYQCRLCARTYKYKYDLRVHLRTHLGIPTKSTLCPFCNAKFDTNKLLRHHIKEAHREHHKALTDEQLQMFDAI